MAQREHELSCNGWFHGYNFGSIEAARIRWRAAIQAHVDYLASDQYELLGEEIRQASVTAESRLSPAPHSCN